MERYTGDELWTHFKATCAKVIADFDYDPTDTKQFRLSRSGDHDCTITKAGNGPGPNADFNINIEAAHTFTVNADETHEIAPYAQFNGWLSPLAIALMMALYPLVLGPISEPDTKALIDAACGNYTT